MTLLSVGLRAAPVPFVAALGAHGGRPALLTADGAVSYEELNGRVRSAAAALGTTRRLVLLGAAPEIDTVVTYLACLAAGHPVLLAPAGKQQPLVAAYNPDVVVTPGSPMEVRRPGTAHQLHPDLALLLSTSGSTGSPKLVRLSHHNLQANAASIAKSLAIRSTDRAITSLPLHYSYGLSVLHSHLLQGAATVLTSLSVVDQCFWDLFRSHGVTTLAGVPHTFALLDRVGFADLDLPSLRLVTQAGGRLAPERVQELAALGQRRGWDLVVMYGQTEATARMACLPADLAASHPQAIGLPIPGGSFTLAPVEESPAPDVGELVYSGPNVMLGYATSSTDLQLGRTVTQLHTGDLARRTDQGLYEIVGRRSRFLKIFGLRIDLDQVESALGATCLGNDEELVVAVEGPADLELVRRNAARASGLPLTAVRVCAIEQLPRTPAGKVDCAALRALTTAPKPGATVSSVGELFAQVLERDDVTPASTFVDLGGDSLSFVETSLRLEELLGQLPTGWHLQTVAELEAADRPRRRWGRSIDTGVVLRAVAIVLIVAHHAHLFRVLGGAHLLLGVAGFNLARFQLTAAPQRERLARLARSTARILVPSVAAIGFAFVVTGRYTWEHVLLVHDVLSYDQAPKHFWFVEVLLQVLLVLLALLAVPALDRLERRLPFALPIALLGVGLLARFDVLPAVTGKERLFTPAAVFWLFALGWAAAKARNTTQRLLVSAVLVVSLPGYFGANVQRGLLVGAALLLLIWVPHLRVPRVAVPVIGVLASSSLYIYLTHNLVLPPLYGVPVVAFAASFAVGLAYWQLASRAMTRLERCLTTAARAGRHATPTPRRQS